MSLASPPGGRTGTPPEAALPDVAVEFGEQEYRQYITRKALELMRSEFQPSTWQACWGQVVGGRSAAEVAAELGLSEGAARSAKFRVLTRLRQELRELLD